MRAPSSETPEHASIVPGRPIWSLSGWKAEEPIVAPALPMAAEKPFNVLRRCAGKVSAGSWGPEQRVGMGLSVKG